MMRSKGAVWILALVLFSVELRAETPGTSSGDSESLQEAAKPSSTNPASKKKQDFSDSDEEMDEIETEDEPGFRESESGDRRSFSNRKSLLRYHADAIRTQRSRLNVDFFLGGGYELDLGSTGGAARPFAMFEYALTTELSIGLRSDSTDTVYESEVVPLYGGALTLHYYVQSIKFQGVWIQLGVPFMAASSEFSGSGMLIAFGGMGTLGYRFSFFGTVNLGVAGGAKVLSLPSGISTTPIVMATLGLVL
jgi:hypothetical protein